MAKTTQSQPVLPTILTIRGNKVVLDSELATLYGVPTFRFNEAVKRNTARFPADFRFQVTPEEAARLVSQMVKPSVGEAENLRSQSAILKSDARGKHRKYLPWVFTEHGALMAANVLRSERAVEMSLYLIRAFVEMREALLTNATILKHLAEIDRRLIQHDSVLREVIEHLQPLLAPPETDESTRPKIGFHRGNR